MDVAVLALGAAGCAERAVRLCRGLQSRTMPRGHSGDDGTLLTGLADRFDRSGRELLSAHRQLQALAVPPGHEMLELLRGRLNSVNVFFAAADCAVQSLVAVEQDASKPGLWFFRNGKSAKLAKLAKLALLFDDYERDICSLRVFLRCFESQQLCETATQ